MQSVFTNLVPLFDNISNGHLYQVWEGKNFLEKI
jgi:hypothetical protein